MPSDSLALLGMHDPQLLIDDGGSAVYPSATLALLDRMATLHWQAWEEASIVVSEFFWRKRSPDLRIALQPASSSPRVTPMPATTIDPDPLPEKLRRLWGHLPVMMMVKDRLSFGPTTMLYLFDAYCCISVFGSA
jgi:hypothetical protein